MKLAFLAPEFYNSWGGVGIYSIELIKGLSKLDNLEIHVITPNIKQTNKKNKLKSIFNENVNIHIISNANDTFIYNLKFQAAVFKEFNKLNNKYKFDILHSANLVNMPDILLKFNKIEIPSLVTAHTTIKGQVKGFLKGNINPFKMASSEKLSLLAYPYISFLEYYYLKKTDNLITVSKKFGKLLKKEYKYKGKITTIYNSIDINHYNFNKIKEEDCMSKFPFLKNINKPIILYAGRLISQKGIDIFIKSIKLLQDKGYNFHYIIAGKGNTNLLYNNLKKNKIDKNNINYVGYIDNRNLVYLYRMSDIFTLPSYYENLPISLLEAMSMKSCCISTNVGAVDEVIDNNKNGILINPGDYKKLAENIIFLTENPEIIRKISKNAREKVLKNFRSDIMAKKTLDVYKNIVNNFN